jgi:TPR repeat protein
MSAAELGPLRSCAEQGDVHAQSSLGHMYRNGLGVPEDDVLAYMWWNLAAAQGHARARENKDILEQRMTREQIAEGQRLSREWIEAHPPGN